MGLFDKKQHITRPQLRDILKKTPSQNFNTREREGMEQEIFGKKYGSFLDKSEFNRKISELSAERYKAKTYVEKSKIDKKIKLVKEILKKG
jgi:hypothetical protein